MRAALQAPSSGFALATESYELMEALSMALEASLFSDQSRLNGLIMRIPQADSGAPSLGLLPQNVLLKTLIY